MATNQVESVQLTIRCALEKFSDYNVECPLDWSVLQLKQHLAALCEFKPEVGRQRLIYAGHCLENGQKISEVLKKHRDGIQRPAEEQLEKQVIHMVYIGAEPPKLPQSGLRHRNTAGNVENSPPNAQNNPPVIGQPTMPQMVPPTQMPMMQPMPMFGPQQSHEAWLAAYQNYMLQMAQFYQQHQAGMFHRMPMAHGAWNAGQFGLPMGGPVLTNQQFYGIPVGQQQPLLNAPVVAQNVIANPPQIQIPPAAAENNNNEVRHVPDVLDLVYKSIRFILLGMLLYVYSSVERFFFVLAIVALFWFVHARRGQRQQLGRRNEQQMRQNGAAGGQQGQENEAPLNPNIDANQPDAAAAADGEVPPADAPLQDGQPTVSAVIANNSLNIFNAVQSFFTSLIPEAPAPLDIN